MPEIQIRSAIPLDITTLIQLDHSTMTDYVWQIAVQQPEDGEIDVSFRQVRLPRSAQVAYYRSPLTLQDDWQQRSGLLVASLWIENGPALADRTPQVVGYIGLIKDPIPAVAWITDLVVNPYQRRRGIGAALILAAQDWAAGQNFQRLNFAVQPKNHPAINLAQKLGFSFCGYHDRYYPNQEIALFFSKSIRSVG